MKQSSPEPPTQQPGRTLDTLSFCDEGRESPLLVCLEKVLLVERVPAVFAESGPP